jgi:hypothetical protein
LAHAGSYLFLFGFSGAVNFLEGRLMKKTILLCAAVAAVACVSPVMAAPSIQFVDNLDSTVTLQVVTTANGSLGAELAVEVSASPGLLITSAVINSAVFDTANPGDNPFIPGSPVGGDTNGLWTNFPLGQIFASYGSGVVSPGTYDFLTLGVSGVGTLDAFGLVASQGQLNSGLSASITLIPEPMSAALVGLAAFAGFARRRAG